MNIRIDVGTRGGDDPRGDQICARARRMGVSAVSRVCVADLYFLHGDLTDAQIERLVAELLADGVATEARWRRLPSDGDAGGSSGRLVEVGPQPGVTDTVAENLLAAANAQGFGLEAAGTGHRYTLTGEISDADLARLATGLLANPVVQRWTIDAELPPPAMAPAMAAGGCAPVPLRDADDAGLLAISAERRLSMDLLEMRAIRAHFQEQGREPTDLELEMLAQTWSEHCVHKTFKARIDMTDAGERVEIDSIFDTYIRGVTAALSPDWLRSVFVDNAGIIGFAEGWDLAFKVETHNHPSALEPFGGANTGVGGVIRDVIGVSARPIACTDVLCFGPPGLPREALPAGVLHPDRVADGVVAGIGDYGNKMGIPTVSGAVLFDDSYLANPLVFCGCLGVLPTGSHPRAPRVGDLVVVVGGRTGRDGLRGATFSSMEMTEATGEIAGASVQIGHPIVEKMTLDALMIARDEGLYTAITDCGAGGLSSAVGEMAAELGADVELKTVPLKYPGLQPWEIWLSEAQERMVLAVPPDRWSRLVAVCAAHGVEATCLGRFTGDRRMVVRHDGAVMGDLEMAFLHDGVPQRHLVARWDPPDLPPTVLPEVDAGAELLALLATPDIRSKEPILRTFDHLVQGGTVVGPLTGARDRGPSDAAVVVPLEIAEAADWPVPGAVLSVGINPHHGRIDPYLMAWSALDEAVRNAVAVGADPDRIAVLDNFCWGNPALPDRLGGMVRAARGCHDAALAYRTPFISGKDSLNNETTGADGERRAILGTLLISALGRVDDVDETTTMDLKSAGNALYVLGVTRPELGGSAWLRRHGQLGQRAPQPLADPLPPLRALHGAIRGGLVRAVHDCSEGGLGVALAEMALAGERGAEVALAELPCDGVTSDGEALFSESLGRFVIEVAPEHRAAFEERVCEVGTARIGRVQDEPRLRIIGLAGAPIIDLPLSEITRAWRGHVAG